MSKRKKLEMTIRSSAAEYLIYVAATGDNPQSIEMRYEDENIWLTQKMLATLYDVEIHTINEHIKKVFLDYELAPEATIRNFRIVQTEGSRLVNREVKHYNLQMIIAVGFKVNSERAVQFRKWVNKIAKDYTIQGWVMDKERLINGGSILTEEYFEHLLEEIREIRLSERKFYQKITDIYATALDYDGDSKTTKEFFATVQNKLHWAIHGHTAAEVIVDRANAGKECMGLTSWKNAPNGKIIKSDVSIAKNYLSRAELQNLELIVTAEVAKAFAESEFEKYRVIQDRLFQSDFDKLIEGIIK
ncbi:MAG: RhuM family protein [Clostridia bacterium]|nr:RhuM family protein [Clostridia bacterium]